MGLAGLHSDTARDYDSVVGRYVEGDPIGLAGGSYSTHACSSGNSISSDDPSGRASPGRTGAPTFPTLLPTSRFRGLPKTNEVPFDASITAACNGRSCYTQVHSHIHGQRHTPSRASSQRAVVRPRPQCRRCQPCPARELDSKMSSQRFGQPALLTAADK